LDELTPIAGVNTAPPPDKDTETSGILSRIAIYIEASFDPTVVGEKRALMAQDPPTGIIAQSVDIANWLPSVPVR